MQEEEFEHRYDVWYKAFHEEELNAWWEKLRKELLEASATFNGPLSLPVQEVEKALTSRWLAGSYLMTRMNSAVLRGNAIFRPVLRRLQEEFELNVSLDEFEEWKLNPRFWLYLVLIYFIWIHQDNLTKRIHLDDLKILVVRALEDPNRNGDAAGLMRRYFDEAANAYIEAASNEKKEVVFAWKQMARELLRRKDEEAARVLFVAPDLDYVSEKKPIQFRSSVKWCEGEAFNRALISSLHSAVCQALDLDDAAPPSFVFTKFVDLFGISFDFLLMNKWRPMSMPLNVTARDRDGVDKFFRRLIAIENRNTQRDFFDVVELEFSIGVKNSKVISKSLKEILMYYPFYAKEKSEEKSIELSSLPEVKFHKSGDEDYKTFRTDMKEIRLLSLVYELCLCLCTSEYDKIVKTFQSFGRGTLLGYLPEKFNEGLPPFFGQPIHLCHIFQKDLEQLVSRDWEGYFKFGKNRSEDNIFDFVKGTFMAEESDIVGGHRNPIIVMFKNEPVPEPYLDVVSKFGIRHRDLIDIFTCPRLYEPNEQQATWMLDIFCGTGRGENFIQNYIWGLSTGTIYDSLRCMYREPEKFDIHTAASVDGLSLEEVIRRRTISEYNTLNFGPYLLNIPEWFSRYTSSGTGFGSSLVSLSKKIRRPTSSARMRSKAVKTAPTFSPAREYITSGVLSPSMIPRLVGEVEAHEAMEDEGRELKEGSAEDELKYVGPDMEGQHEVEMMEQFDEPEMEKKELEESPKKEGLKRPRSEGDINEEENGEERPRKKKRTEMTSEELVKEYKEIGDQILLCTLQLKKLEKRREEIMNLLSGTS